MKFNEPNAQFINCQEKTFIYFLTLQGHVVYIGKTIKGAIPSNNNPFDGIYILPCEDYEIDFVLNQYLLKYHPQYNKGYNLKGSVSIDNVAKRMRKTYNSRKIHNNTILKMCEELYITPFECYGKAYVADYEADLIVWAVEDYEKGAPLSEVFNIRV